MGVATVNLL
jgi:hypothetical protein